jgi:hypothetical protein
MPLLPAAHEHVIHTDSAENLVHEGPTYSVSKGQSLQELNLKAGQAAFKQG